MHMQSRGLFRRHRTMLGSVVPPMGKGPVRTLEAPVPCPKLAGASYLWRAQAAVTMQTIIARKPEENS